MPQVNTLPFELKPTPDVTGDKASYASKSAQDSGAKKEANAHFSGLVDKHIQDNKNESRPLSNRANSNDNRSERAGSGNKTSDSVMEDKDTLKNKATNEAKNKVETSSDTKAAEEADSQQKIAPEDTRAESEHTDSNSKVKSNRIDSEMQSSDGSMSTAKSDEKNLEQSNIFLNLLDSSSKILQASKGVDEANLMEGSPAGTGKVKSAEEILAALLGKSVKVESADSKDFVGDAETGNELDNEVDNKSTRITQEGRTDNSSNKLANSTASETVKATSGENAVKDKNNIEDESLDKVVGKGTTGLESVQAGNKNNKTENTVAVASDAVIKNEAENQKKDSQAELMSKEVNKEVIEQASGKNSKEQVTRDNEINKANGSSDVNKNTGITPSSKDTDVNRDITHDTAKKEADKMNAVTGQTVSSNATKEGSKSVNNTAADKNATVGEPNSKQQGDFLGEASTSNDNSAKQQGNQKIDVQQPNGIKMPSAAGEEISDAELDHISAEKSVANEEVNNSAPNVINNVHSKAPNTVTDILGHATQALAIAQAHDNAEAVTANAEAVTIEKTEQTQSSVRALNETISIFRKDFSEAVKDKIMVIISQKLQQFEIKLDPPELGSVHVKVNLQNEQAVVNFTVQNQSAKEAFEQNLDKLKDMLAEQGVDVGDANVEQQSAQNTEEGFEQGENNGTVNENMTDELLPEQTILSGNMFDSSASRVDYYA